MLALVEFAVLHVTCATNVTLVANVTLCDTS
jgi:hypothetical protein